MKTLSNILNKVRKAAEVVTATAMIFGAASIGLVTVYNHFYPSNAEGTRNSYRVGAALFIGGLGGLIASSCLGKKEEPGYNENDFYDEE